jgi:rod shape-determining protein MreD
MGTFFLDIIFLPMALCAGATILKALAFFLLHLFFPNAIPSYSLFGLTFWVEIALNTFLAPFIFSFLKLFESLFAGRKEN